MPGRPPGPPRVPLSVRILKDLDDGITRAVEQTNVGPQMIVEAALSSWLQEYGFLPPRKQARTRGSGARAGGSAERQ